MKIRTGHVSNSSSSSFVLWGIRVPETSFKDLIGDKWTKDNYLNEELIRNYVNSILDQKSEIEVRPDRSYFGSYDEKITDFFIGKSPCALEDGLFVNIPEIDKSKLVNTLNKLGFTIKEDDIKLYVQMISNDNF